MSASSPRDWSVCEANSGVPSLPPPLRKLFRISPILRRWASKVRIGHHPPGTPNCDAVWLGVSVINGRSAQLLGSSVEGAVSSEQEVEIHKHVPPVISEKRPILRISGVVVDLQRVLVVAQVDPGYRKAHRMLGAHVYVF